MNFSKLSFLFLLIVAMAACKDDDDSPAICTQSDWVGIYEGTIDCDGSEEAVTVTIAANGAAALDISYTTATLTTEYTEPITPVSCSVNINSSDAGVSLKLDVSLEGDKLTLNEVITDGSTTSTCELTATRK